MENDRILKGLREIAKYYKISTSTARKMMIGAPKFKIGNTYFCYVKELEEYLKTKANG